MNNFNENIFVSCICIINPNSTKHHSGGVLKGNAFMLHNVWLYSGSTSELHLINPFSGFRREISIMGIVRFIGY